MRVKRLFLVLLLARLSGAVLAQGPGFRLEGIGSAAVPVTVEKMTNLIFPEAVQIGVKVSRDILAQKVRGVENVIELKAVRRNFTVTNLSVYGKDGRLYSFLLYPGDSGVMNFRVDGDLGAAYAGSEVMLSGLPADVVRLRGDALELVGRRGFLHRRVRVDGLRLRMTGVYMRDSLEWVVLDIANRTQIAWTGRFARYFVEDRNRVKRRAVQDWVVAPVYGGLPGPVGGDLTVRFAVGFLPFAVPSGKRLVVELAGADGRMVRMTVKSRLLLKAKAE